MILAAGELLIDLVTTNMVSDLSESDQFQVKVGGSCANMALFCHKQGVPVTLFASVGKDGFGEIAINHLKKAGIPTRYVHTIDSHTTVIVVSKSHGTPEFIPYRDADKYMSAIPGELIRSCKIFHTTAFSLSKEPAQQHLLDAAAVAAASGKTISFDWNFATEIWGKGNSAERIFETLTRYKPLLKVSLDDTERFWPGTNGEEQTKLMLDKFKTTATCLTCGAGGVWYKAAGGNWEHQPTLPAKVEDVTGAGDAFWSGFLSGWYLQKPLSDCIGLALQVAKDRLEQRI